MNLKIALRHKERRVSNLALALWLLMVAGAVLFVLARRCTVLNRFTDSWWHIAAADEYLRTGVFARDPFFEEAPPFAQFGLMDFLNAWVCRFLGTRPQEVFVPLVALNVAIFLSATFLAAYWPTGSTWTGLLSSAIWLVVFPGSAIISVGFPFPVASALLTFFLVSLVQLHANKARVWPWLWRGVFLGGIFVLHALVGLVGLVLTAGWALFTLRRLVGQNFAPGLWRLALRWACFGAAFVLIAGRWIALHLSLRPILLTFNAHEREGSALDSASLVRLVLTLAIIGVALLLVRSKVRTEAPDSSTPQENHYRTVSLLEALLLYGVMLFLCAVPPLNDLIRKGTSWYMANRVPWLFPIGPALVLAAVAQRALRPAALVLGARLVMALLALGVVLPQARKWVRLNLYLLRSSEYAEHSYAYLNDLRSHFGRLSGKIVLADPSTSYYVRGMLGAYVVTAIPGVASPAVDFAKRDRVARQALLEGPAALGLRNVELVILDQKNGSTRHFTGRTVNEIVSVWTQQQWRVWQDTQHCVVLVPTGMKVEKDSDAANQGA
ncbi:MAG: hypothetical protein ACUVWX_02465 [Kiritimatiellia bacterium]